MRPEKLRDGVDDLPVRRRCQERGVQPFRPDDESLRTTAWAEAPALAREREQGLGGTDFTADACAPVVKDATGEEHVCDLNDDGTPRDALTSEAVVVDRLQAVEMILHQPKQRRRLWASGLVNVEGHRRR